MFILEKSAVLRNNLIQIFFDFDTYLVIDFHVQIDSDRLARRGNLHFRRARGNEENGREKKQCAV